MQRAVRLAAAAAALVSLAGPAAASLKVNVDIGSQRMQVYVDGKLKHDWAISSGRQGYETPTGNYRPTRMERDWYSRQYDDAPMPHAIFFSGGYAIHGSHETRRLGRPASHGCIRLAPANAARLFALVEDRGRRATSITIDE